MEELSEEERKALRGSKFAPLPPPTSRSHQSRLAHPGGPLKTNKAAALAKFLERKLQDPHGLASIDPHVLDMAVQNAKATVSSSGVSSKSGAIIHHVDSFGDSEEPFEEVEETPIKKQKKKKKKKKKKMKNKKQKRVDDGEYVKPKKPKKKLKL